MYALIDCNNFYCSCERVFNPKLKGRPVVVLSNNDGCIIARSNEAKQLGIAAGTPAYMIRELLKKNNVAVFSSNYTLYGDMSDRVMKTIAGFVPRMEIYSIDEAFLDFANLNHTDLFELGIKIRKTVRQHTGIPVTVGIAKTKTLSKMANKYAKTHCSETGVFYAAGKQLTDQLLEGTDVGDIWGIGHQHALLLRRNKFKTAASFIAAPNEWVRDKMSVVGERLLNELKGIPSIKWEFETAAKKNICYSRAFGKVLTEKEEIKEAVVNYAANCALKLREQKTVCKTVNVFLHTNPHKTQESQFQRSIDVELERPSNNSAEIIKYVLKGFDVIFQKGYRFMKAGVIVMDIIPEGKIQSSLFDTANTGRDGTVMKAMDKINQALGKNVVRMAVQGFEKNYRMKAEHLSPCYTTNIDHILKVSI